MFYTYQVLIGDQWNEAVDPYAAAVGVNGDRAYIVDMAGPIPNVGQTRNRRSKARWMPLSMNCMFVITPFIRTVGGV